MPDHKLTTLDTGLSVVSEHMPGVHSVALGFWIGTGSRFEDHAQAGLSHLIEHLLFRGSERYGSTEIDQLFDGIGAELNAGTGKESTSLYARFLHHHLETAFDAMADMVWRPAFEDLDAERDVVLEEIAMYEDDPQELVFDLLGGATFGDHPLGRAIIGRAEVVGGAPRKAISEFHRSRYTPDNVVIAAAGAVDHEELVALATAASNSSQSQQASTPKPASERHRPRAVFRQKETEQFHVCVGGVGIALHDERRFALRILDTVLGGSSSSRLFQEVRERRGLAYSIHSFNALFADTGQVGLYLGTRTEHLAEAIEVVGEQLNRVAREGVTERELERAKENSKGRIALARESTSARMGRIGSALLASIPLLSVEEIFARIDRVSTADVAELAGELFVPEKLSVAGIGSDQDLFRSALGNTFPVVAEPDSAVGAH